MSEKLVLGDHVVTWKGFLVVIVPLMAIVMGVEHRSLEDLDAKVDTRVSRDEFTTHVANQNRWQDRMESKLEALSKIGVIEDGDQFQYVLVQLPAGEVLHDQRVRDVLAKQGLVDGKTERNQ